MVKIDLKIIISLRLSWQNLCHFAISSTFYVRVLHMKVLFCQNITREKHFCTKNVHVICWWNWHLSDRQFWVLSIRRPNLCTSWRRWCCSRRIQTEKKNISQRKDSQNFLGQICKTFCNFRPEILGFYMTIHGFWSRYLITTVKIMNYKFSMYECFVKASKSYENLSNFPQEVLWISTQGRINHKSD